MGVGRILSRGGRRGFSQKFFQGRTNVVKFCFYPLEIERQPFFANNFKIQGGPWTPPDPPSDAHDRITFAHNRETHMTWNSLEIDI